LTRPFPSAIYGSRKKAMRVKVDGHAHLPCTHMKHV